MQNRNTTIHEHMTDMGVAVTINHFPPHQYNIINTKMTTRCTVVIMPCSSLYKRQS